jgi:SAM-dependent methyltransferase
MIGDSRQLYPLAMIKRMPDSFQATTGDTRSSLSIAQGLTLESFTRSQEIREAYRWYCNLIKRLSIESFARKAEEPLHDGLVLVGDQRYLCRCGRFDEAYRLANLVCKATRQGHHAFRNEIQAVLVSNEIIDVSANMEIYPSEYIRFVSGQSSICDIHKVRSDFKSFEDQYLSLYAAGHLTIAPGYIRFGDLKRLKPFCPSYGYSRGTPIDRIYTAKFSKSYEHVITGRVLDVGTKKQMSPAANLIHVSELTTLDVDPASGADIIADAHTCNIFPEHSFDCVLLFNVLEHCEEPWVVVRNAHHWLKPGGAILSVTPACQRVHPGPKDYWRILPDAFVRMFNGFASCEIITFGNALTSLAALYGIAAEEVSRNELFDLDPAYPVAICVYATKAKPTQA